MTVSELAYQTAIKERYNLAQLSPALKDFAESHQKALEIMREPMKTASLVAETMRGHLKSVSSMIESIRPQMEATAKLSIPSISQITMPTLPVTLDEEDGYFIPSLIRPVQEVRIVNLEDITIAPARQERERVASYQLPHNAKWESLEIKFIDGYIVSVSYPNLKAQRFDYKDMGFANKRTTEPDIKWELLRTIANRGGALTKEHWDRRLHRNIKYKLNEGLKRFFGMTTSPIPRYTRRDGYATLFLSSAQTDSHFS